MNQSGSESSLASQKGAPSKEDRTASFQVWGVRYQVKDVDRAVAFYADHLGFTLEHQTAQMFAKVSLGGISLLLSGPGSSGSRPLPDGRQQEPGGWNRLVIRVNDLPSHIRKLKEAGVRLRNEMAIGPSGKQIQLEDPDGNPIELFEPAERAG
jgi:glyoxylase I family protein